MTANPRDEIFLRYNAAIAAGDRVAALRILREYDTYSDARARWKRRPAK